MKQKKSLIFLSALLIITGIDLTLENFHIISGISRLWPILVLILGAGFLLLFFERGKRDPVLAWLGTFQTLIAVLFLYLNYATWTLMRSLWPFFLGITGVSFLSAYFTDRNSVYMYMAIALIMLFLAFYLVFSISLLLWPLSLVVFGISLLVVNYYNSRK
jgi:TRAP-type C4-dicarboxylate transport system permease small subunit